MWAESLNFRPIRELLSSPGVRLFSRVSLEKQVVWARTSWADFLSIVFALSCEERFSTGCRSFGIFLHILLGCPLRDLPLLFTVLQNIRGSTGKKAAEQDTIYRIWFIRPIREVWFWMEVTSACSKTSLSLSLFPYSSRSFGIFIF